MTTQVLTYDRIKNLLEQSEVQGKVLQCTFRCPASGIAVPASGKLPDDKSLQGRWSGKAGKGLLKSLSRKIRTSMGNGQLGRLAGDFLVDAGSEAGRKASLSTERREAAVVSAFQSVSRQFSWDAELGSYRVTDGDAGAQ